MANPVPKNQLEFDRDATHQVSKLDTHLTHGCMADFSHFWSVRRARSGLFGVKNARFMAFSEHALSAPGEAVT